MRVFIDEFVLKKSVIDFNSWLKLCSIGISAMPIHLVVKILIVGSILFAPSAVLAEPPNNVTPQEKGMLPEFCKYTQGALGGNEKVWDPSPGARYWMGVFGGEGQTSNLWVMHHYCYALIHMSRGYRGNLSKMQYEAAWTSVVNEIDFTLGYRPLPLDFILMPQMMLYRGRALMRLKQHGQAIQSFEKAIEAKPDYWPPYRDIADYYVSAGGKAKAISILQEGLVHAPDAKPLKQRLTELGGVIPLHQVKKEPPPPAIPSSGPP